MYSSFHSTLICLLLSVEFFFQMSEINPTKLDVFLAKVEQRKACEKKAFETSMILIDPDKVNDETLINTVRIIMSSFD